MLRSRKYLNSVVYLIICSSIKEYAEESTEGKRVNTEGSIKKDPMGNFNKEILKLIDPVKNTYSKSDKEYLQKRSRRGFDLLCDEVEKIGKYAPDALCMFVLYQKFVDTEAFNSKMHSDFKFFTNYDNYSNFFDVMEETPEVDTGVMSDIAIKLVERLG